MPGKLTNLFRTISLCLSVLVLTACGGGSDSNTEVGSDSAQRTGAVGVLLTDAPADPDDFIAVNVTIEAIELIGDGGKETVYSGPAQTINLLDLKNESMPFAFQDGIPAGEYCKIRLTLSELELVLTDDTPEDDTDNETAYPKLPGNNKLDLNARDCFEVEGGGMLVIQLDIDAGRSIHITEGKDKYQFRPVVFVDALVEEFDPKMLRLSGNMVSYDAESNSFVLCDALPTEGISNAGCVEIQLTEDSAFFDNVSYSGTPRALDEIFMDEKLETEFTVVGWPEFIAPPYIDVDIPEGQLPPIGECLVWDLRLEPGLQSDPIDCDEIPTDLPDEFVTVDSSGLVFDPFRPVIVVEALVVEYGDFLIVEGTANAAADESGVNIAVAPGDALIADDLAVSFQQGEVGVNGTRFVTKEGEVMDYTAILSDTPLQIDGVLELISESESALKAALVIIDYTAVTDDSLAGEITAVGETEVLITLDEPELCGISASTFELDLTSDFDLLTVIITEDGSEVMSDGSFAIGQSVGITGSCEETVFAAESVVIVDDQRVITL